VLTSVTLARQTTAYLQHQLWAIEQATQAERKYEEALQSMSTRAKDERRAVIQETNGARRLLPRRAASG